MVLTLHHNSMQIFTSIHDPQLAQLLQTGAVGVLPTDTVYGLVCSAADEQAAIRMHATKGREYRPGTIIAANIEQLVGLGLRPRYLRAVEQFWPGAVSVRVPHPAGYLVDVPTGTVAVRIPADESLRKFLEQTGPLHTTSANITGEPVATVLSEAQDYFGDAVDFYVDGGDLSDSPPSTIIQIVDDAIEVIRQGAVHIDGSGRVA